MIVDLEKIRRIGTANEPLSKNLMIFFAWTFFGLIGLAIFFRSYKALILTTIMICIICTFQAALRLTACLFKKPQTSLDTDIIDWPFYTVLVPLYREAHMVETLMTGLSSLDYPAERLEILMICEEIDPFTIAMVKQHIKPPFKLIIVPKGQPQTKPRALNYAMISAKGELVTIYDAEDIPHPAQLKMAAAVFQNNPNLGAIQAPLDYRNSNENWLTRQFSLEYAALFHVWNPFLAKLNLPFPLGGTSNHLRRKALDIVGGWDSYNVTEDADISFRFAAFGWEFASITPATSEEAVNSWRSWFFQRSRWMKGFMQTFIVHMKSPMTSLDKRGLKRFFTLQLTIGLTLLNALFHLPIIIMIACVISWQILTTGLVYIPIYFMGSLIISYLAGILIGIIGAIRAGKPRLILSALAMPIYWLALCFPAIHALWELGRKPFFWHKTHHSGKSASRKSTALDIPYQYDAFR